MDNDVFVEYLVKKKKTGKDYLIQIGVVLAALVIIFLAFALSPYLGAFSIISTLVIVAVIYGAYYLFTNTRVEFEYILTNGEMDIDKIIAQRKRKRLITVKCKDFETFGRYTPEAHISQNIQNKMFVCDSPASPNVYYATLRHPTKGSTLIVMNVNEKFATNMKKYIPRNVRGDALDW